MREKSLPARAFDAVFSVLMRPRSLRRWSFLITVPAGLFGAKALGIDLNVGTGLKAGIALAALDLAVLLAVVAIGTRVLGRERRDVLLDFLMHPTARRAIAAEARTLLILPRALGRRLRQPAGREFTYHRGTNELGFVLALLPAAFAGGRGGPPAPPRRADVAAPGHRRSAPLRDPDAPRVGPRAARPPPPR